MFKEEHSDSRKDFSMKALFIFLFLFSFAAHANFSGQWSGEFRMTNKKGETYLCDDLNFTVLQDQKQALFGKWTYSCGGYAFSYMPPTLQFDDGKVYLKNKYNDYVGTVSDNEADITVVVNDVNGRTHIHVKKTADSEMEYFEEQIDVDPDTGKDVKSIFEATLKKI
jgi:hypothetical protein